MKTRHVLAVLAAGAIGFVAAGCGRTPAATPPPGKPPLGKSLTDESESVPFDIMLLPDKFSPEQALTFERVFGELTPEKHKMYEASKHRAAGLYCVTCHLDAEIDAEAGTARLTSFKVPTQVCAECHEDEHEGFTKSRHAEALTVFSHVIRYHALNGYPAMQQQGCNKCHEKVGNTCTSCHPGHLFKSPKPPVDDYGGCAQCHLGIDHHQLESYQSSVHYQVAQASGDGTPNCVYCHSEDDNPHDIFRIKGEPDHGRTKMTAKCLKCHTEEFTRDEFAKIDAIKKETHQIVDEAREIVAALYADGVLEKTNGSLLDETGRPLLNANMTAYDQHIHPIENLLFRMFKYDAVATIAGAQHFSPVRTHWYGHAQLMETYNRVRQEAKQLRFQHELEKRLGIKIKQRPPYRYSHETGHEFDDMWKDPAKYREQVKKFYSEVNK